MHSKVSEDAQVILMPLESGPGDGGGGGQVKIGIACDRPAVYSSHSMLQLSPESEA